MGRTMTWAAVAATCATFVLVGCSGDGDPLPGAGGSDGIGGFGNGGDGVGGTGNAACPECTEQGTGVGTNDPFDPETNPSSGVGLDDDGALVLDSSKTDIPGIIWIANTNEGTVTKVDTDTYQIMGRYQIGTNDPSRTSVNSRGDAFVGNRSGNSLTKISAAGDDCPDTNGDSAITTSTGFNDVLAWGQDDCVLWDVPVPDSPTVRGVAAQDLVVPDPLPDFPEHSKVEHYVWVGGTGQQKVYRFDGETGDLLINTAAPTSVYGLALDGNGHLWISGAMQGGVIGRIDTTKCSDQASCDAAEICERDCSSGVCSCTSCSTDCDDAIKERIQLPQSVYGITVDFKQRVWTGGYGVQRYDPQAPIGQRYASTGANTAYIHGIAADAEGWVWGAATSSGVLRVDGDSMESHMVSVPSAKGMAVDKDGKVWAIAWGDGAHVITPGNTSLTDYTTTTDAVTGLGYCYTYSDMTGMQLALATDEPGYYRETFSGCAQGTQWYELTWNVETPTATMVRFIARSAATPEGLEQATWVSLAKIPTDEPPKNIANAFMAAGQTMHRYLEVEVSLYGSLNGNTLVSPRVLNFGVSHHCPDVPR